MLIYLKTKLGKNWTLSSMIVYINLNIKQENVYLTFHYYPGDTTNSVKKENTTIVCKKIFTFLIVSLHDSDT